MQRQAFDQQQCMHSDNHGASSDSVATAQAAADNAKAELELAQTAIDLASSAYTALQNAGLHDEGRAAHAGSAAASTAVEVCPGDAL
jgi:outer membrane protein TolC